MIVGGNNMLTSFGVPGIIILLIILAVFVGIGMLIFMAIKK